MRLSHSLVYVVVGILVAEALVWCALLPWLHHRYTTGLATNQLWKPVIVLAVVGAALGLAAFATRSVFKSR